MKTPTLLLLVGSLALALSGLTPAQAAVDEDAAKSFAKKNDCFKCHAVDKTKKGPSYKKIVEKNKDKPDVEAKFYKHLTTSPKVKLEDGTEEEHKGLDSKDEAQIKNLIGWILTR